MKPVNSKSLFSCLCEDYEKLRNGEISNADAVARAISADKIQKQMYYELQRAKVLFTINGSGTEIRDIELKAFNDAPKQLAG